MIDVARTPGPLDGIRVVDLTVVWSGPGGTALLGDLGAEVIRVEGNDRISRQVSAKVTKESIAAAGYHGGTYPDKDPGARPYDRTALFNWHARNKLAACMNLDTPEGHRAMLDLLAVSDVLVENNSPGVLERLGLGHELLTELFPRLVVARMPPLGLTGEMSSYLGYGPNFNSLVGIASLDGYTGEGPESAGENYHMDEAAPAGLAFAVLVALWDRETTGRGAVIEFSQAENVMAEIGEYLVDLQRSGQTPAVLGNTDHQLFQDVCPTSDPSRFVAVSVRERDWPALARLLHRSDWSRLPAPEEQAQRREALRDWLAVLTPEIAVSTLQAARIPAGEVMSEPRLLDDEHLAERRWFQQRSHPAVGTHRYPGHQWKADGFDLVFGRCTPGFGQDNEYVYRTVLGYDADRFADLVRRGLVTDEQFA
jgi:crotonobetainyl-CoA:carnitine CoA-transferase CaiB-like acyl-CoA transferase